MFKSLFKPKWQHANPEVRLQAIKGFSAADPQQRSLLTRLALSDQEASVRIEAWRHLPDSDWSLLTQAWQQESDAVLRTLLEQRLFSQIEALVSAPSGFELMAWLERQQHAALWEHLAAKAVWPELRRRALERIERESSLFDAVLQDPSLELRLLALGRIDKTATLERLLRETRNKDKTVSKVLKERLNERAEQANRPIKLNADALRICLQLDALSLSSAPVATLTDAWDKLQAQWQQLTADLGPDLSAETRQRFARVERAYQTRYQQHQQQQAAEQAHRHWCAEQRAVRAPLVERLQALESALTTTNLAESREVAEQIQQAWQALPALDKPGLEELVAQFRQSSQRLGQKLAQLPVLEQHEQQLTALVAQLNAVTDPLPSAGQLKHWRRQLAEPPVDALRPLWQQGQERLNQLSEQVEQQQQQRQHLRQQQRQQIQQQLDGLQQAVDAGKLRESQQLVNQLQKRLTKSDEPELDARFSQLKQRVLEWRDWQSWVATPRKEALCAVIEQLVVDPKPVLEQARLVQEARALWQQLGLTEPQSAQSLWERFNQACTQAYAPCKALFDQQAQQRQQARTEREALSEQIELQFAAYDWAQPDWRQLEADLKAWREQWRSLGTMQPDQRKSANERFYAALNQFEQRRQQAFQHSLAAKHGILQQAEQLLTAEDRAASIETIKSLQQQWRALGRSGQDKELWLRFRGLCDQIFALRDQEKQQQLDILTQQRQQRYLLLTAMSELLNSASQIPDLTEQWQTLQQQWQQLPGSDSSSHSKWQQHQREFNELLHRRQQQRRQAERLAVLDDSKAASQQLAGLIGLIGSKKLDAAQLEQWRQTLTPQTAPELVQRAQSLAECLKTAPATASAWLLEQQQQVRPQAEHLCLKMEILSGISSPAEFAEQRLQQQLQNLSQKLLQGETELPALEAGLALQQQWLALEPLVSASLKARFEQAVQAWQQQLG